MAPFLADDGSYPDVPYGPTLAARGPADIIARIKIGFEPLSDHRNHDGLLVVDGDDVIYEHSERWEWPTGEVAVLPFVTVHHVRDGAITWWKDYWDSATLVRRPSSTVRLRPPMADLAAADTIWVFDATGHV